MRGPDEFAKKLKKANLILDSAIKIDPKYHIAYQNKLDNLISLREYKRALAVSDSLLKIRASLEIMTVKGVLLQKLGNTPAAKIIYQKALKVGHANYIAKPSANLVCNITVVHFFLGGKQKALNFLDAERKKFANEPKSLKQIDAVENFLPILTVDLILRDRPQPTQTKGAKKPIS